MHGVRGGEIADGLSADDFVYEVGTGGIVEGADDELRGKKAGDIVEIDAPQLQGGAGKLRVLVKQVREKVLPEANDEWASDASEFDTIEELRKDLRNPAHQLEEARGAAHSSRARGRRPRRAGLRGARRRPSSRRRRNELATPSPIACPIAV